MKKLLFIALVLFAGCQSNTSNHNAVNVAAQQSEEVMFPFNDTLVNWSNVAQKQGTAKEKVIQIARHLLKDEFSIYGDYGKAAKFDSLVHVIDFNGDGFDDIIYNGSGGGEAYEVAVLLNTSAGFKTLVKQPGRLIKMQFNDKKLHRLFIRDLGCCDDFMEYNTIYQLSYKANAPELRCIYLTADIRNIQLPATYFKSPIHFEVLNNDYKVRYAPMIDDTTDNGVSGNRFIGNNIDTLNKGVKGRAIAAKTDQTGRIWWLVEIDSSYHHHGDLFFEQSFNPKLTSSRMGWISSRFVRTVNK